MKNNNIQHNSYTRIFEYANNILTAVLLFVYITIRWSIDAFNNGNL